MGKLGERGAGAAGWKLVTKALELQRSRAWPWGADDKMGASKAGRPGGLETRAWRE